MDRHAEAAKVRRPFERGCRALQEAALAMKRLVDVDLGEAWLVDVDLRDVTDEVLRPLIRAVADEVGCIEWWPLVLVASARVLEDGIAANWAEAMAIAFVDWIHTPGIQTQALFGATVRRLWLGSEG